MTHTSRPGRSQGESQLELPYGGDMQSQIDAIQADAILLTGCERDSRPAVSFSALEPSADYVVRLGKEEVVTWRSYGCYGGALVVEQLGGPNTQSGFLVVGGSLYLTEDRRLALRTEEWEELTSLVFPPVDTEACQTTLGTPGVFDHCALRQGGLLYFREALLPEELSDSFRVDEQRQAPVDCHLIAVEPNPSESLTLIVPTQKYVSPQPILGLFRLEDFSPLL